MDWKWELLGLWPTQEPLGCLGQEDLVGDLPRSTFFRSPGHTLRWGKGTALGGKEWKPRILLERAKGDVAYIVGSISYPGSVGNGVSQCCGDSVELSLINYHLTSLKRGTGQVPPGLCQLHPAPLGQARSSLFNVLRSKRKITGLLEGWILTPGHRDTLVDLGRE